MPIVEAVGSAASVKGAPNLAKQIEAAMQEAIRKSYAEGVIDPVKVKERILAARDEVLKGAGR